MDLTTILNLTRALDAFAGAGDGRPTPPKPDLRDKTTAMRGVLLRRLTTLHLTSPGPLDLRSMSAIVRAMDTFMARGDGHPSPVADSDLDIAAAFRAELVDRIAQAHENGELIAELHGAPPRQPPNFSAIMPKAAEPAPAPAVEEPPATPPAAEEPLELTPAMLVGPQPVKPVVSMEEDTMRFGAPPPAEASDSDRVSPLRRILRGPRPPADERAAG